MAVVDLAKTVVVFDLDDTLFAEADYVSSGMRHVCAQIESIYGMNPYDRVQTAMQDGAQDWLAAACECMGLPATAKESLLWMYRLHCPSIQLSADCKAALDLVSSRALAVAVLTDGRTVTQRLKLKALGLEGWPAYISQDYGADKPDPARYVAVQRRHVAAHYVYVGDNVHKDFYACNDLGWTSIGMRGDSRNVHAQVINGLPSQALPTHWVDGWAELTRLLC